MSSGRASSGPGAVSVPPLDDATRRRLRARDGGESRGLVAIDPRPCVGDPAFDAVDWVFWRAQAPSWPSRSEQLAGALGVDPARLWEWCSAFAALLAAGRLARGQAPSEVAPLLALAP